MDKKKGSLIKKSLRIKTLLLFFLLIFPLVMGCEANQRVIAIIAAVQNYFLDKDEEPISSDFIEMTATGGFTYAEGSVGKYTLNVITLHWFVNSKTGEVKPTVWGEGFWYADAGEIWTHVDLTFEGTISPDGQTLSGGIHSIGSTSWGSYIENLDYWTNWTATRRGDYIEGLADGLAGPFVLTVQPAQYPEP